MSTSPRWRQQNAWFIDPQNVSATASDENDGLTSATAIVTMAEFRRRIGPGPIILGPNRQIIITVMSDLPGADPVDLEVSAANPLLGPQNAFVSFVTPLTPAESGQVNVTTGANQATNTVPVVLPVGITLTDNTSFLRSGTFFLPLVESPASAGQLLVQQRANRATESLLPLGLSAVDRIAYIRLPVFRLLGSQKSIFLTGFDIDASSMDGCDLLACVVSQTGGNQGQVRNCTFRACQLGYAGVSIPLRFFRSSGESTYLASVFGNGSLGNNDTALRQCSIVQMGVDSNAYATINGNVPGDGTFVVNGTNIRLGAGSTLRVIGNRGLFGQDDSFFMESSSTVSRDQNGSIDHPSIFPVSLGDPLQVYSVDPPGGVGGPIYTYVPTTGWTNLAALSAVTNVAGGQRILTE